MSMRTAVDESKAKAAIDAVKDRKRERIEAVEFPQRARLAKLRHKLGKDLQPFLAGLDLGKVDQALKANQAELRRSLAQDKEATAKQLAALAAADRAGLANTRRAIEHIKFKPYLTTLIPVETPFLIGARPAGFMTGSAAAPGDNWATAVLNSNQDTSASSMRASFYFAWQNPTSYLAVLNASADLVLNGSAGVDAQPGIITGGSATVSLRAELNAFIGQFEISYQQNQKVALASLSTDGGGIFGLGDVLNQSISTTAHLGCTSIEVQGDQMAVFEVALVADYSLDDGHAVADFSADRAIFCPGLNIELLTPPGPDDTPI
ncbi:MAG TPA: hypothetical protein VHE77_20200 [Dongiaceae bacterium]|nr:hypothetical protein [Dongiaceae bacterium]